MSSHVKETFAWLRTQGLDPALVRVQKHVVVDCTTETGQVIRLVFPVTPSDKRGTLNFRAYVKRRLRQLKQQ